MKRNFSVLFLYFVFCFLSCDFNTESKDVSFNTSSEFDAKIEMEEVATFEAVVNCSPGERICSFSDVLMCKLDGSDFVFLKNCPSGCKDGDCIKEEEKKDPTLYDDILDVVVFDLSDLNEEDLNEEKFIPSYLDECPDGVCNLIGATCVTSYEPEFTGYRSICTFRCWIDPESNTEYVFYMLDEIQTQTFNGTCATLFNNGATCCGNATDVGKDYFYYYCVLPEGCCPEPLPIRCGANCCLKEEKCNQETKKCEPK